MSAETLRRAAALMHVEESATLLAVADWLEQAARLHENGSTGPRDMPAALAVARAYLGEVPS